MIKNELTRNVSNKLNISHDSVKKIVNQFLEEIDIALTNGDEVILRNLGVFSVEYRHRSTLESFKSNKRKEVFRYEPKFKPSKGLINQIDRHLKKIKK